MSLTSEAPRARYLTEAESLARGAFDLNTRRKPQAFAADAVSLWRLNQSPLINHELELFVAKADIWKIWKLPGACGSSMAQKQRPWRLRRRSCGRLGPNPFLRLPPKASILFRSPIASARFRKLGPEFLEAEEINARPCPQEARGRAGAGAQSTFSGRFLDAGMTVRNTPVGGMRMGSCSRSSHGASRLVCSALAQQKQVESFKITRQDSQYHASSSGIAKSSPGRGVI